MKSWRSSAAKVYDQANGLFLQGDDLGRVTLKSFEQHACHFVRMIAVDGADGLIVKHADLVQRDGVLGQLADEVLAALVDGHDAEMLF